MDTSDEDLLRRVPTDAGAYEEFYRRHVRRITRFAARRCERPADVGDVVSATFLAVPDAADRFDPKRGSAKSWLFGIAAHEVAAIRRRSKADHSLVQHLAGQRTPQADDMAEIEAQIEAAGCARTLSRTLASAPPAERELLLLVVEEDLTPSEAARVLGITPVAARVRLARARRRLRDAIETAERPEPPPVSTPRPKEAR